MAATSEVTMSLDLFKSRICAARIAGLKEALEIATEYGDPRSVVAAKLQSRIEELEKGNANG